MEMSSIKKFFGVPVVVQLRFPLAMVLVSSKGKLPYADNPDHSQWIPEPMMEGGSPVGQQLIPFAVLREIAESGSTIEMVWASAPSAPPKGSLVSPVSTVGTLIDAKDILAVTRVIATIEPSSLILAP